MENPCPHCDPTAEQAMAELWGTYCPDCGPTDYAAILAHVLTMVPAPAPTRETLADIMRLNYIGILMNEAKKAQRIGDSYSETAPDTAASYRAQAAAFRAGATALRASSAGEEGQ